MPYLIRPQRFTAGKGYTDCEPHQASRVVVFLQTRMAPRNSRKAYIKSETLATYYGAGALADAQALVLKLEGYKTAKPRPTLFRSLTRSEYNEAKGR